MVATSGSHHLETIELFQGLVGGARWISSIHKMSTDIVAKAAVLHIGEEICFQVSTSCRTCSNTRPRSVHGFEYGVTSSSTVQIEFG